MMTNVRVVYQSAGRGNREWTVHMYHGMEGYIMCGYAAKPTRKQVRKAVEYMQAWAIQNSLQ